MKRFYTFAALLFLVLGATCLTSCSKDDDDNGGGSKTTTATFTYDLSDDFLGVFNVTLKAASGSTTQNISLTNGKSVTFKTSDLDSYSYTGKEYTSSMSVGASSKVTVTATVSLKSGWESYASGKDLKLGIKRTITSGVSSDTDKRSIDFKNGQATEELLNDAASIFVDHLGN